MKIVLCLFGFLFGVCLNAFAGVVVVDFESFNSLDSITAQIPGLTFTNTTVLTAGISLNEQEFPPHSGVNVVFDDSGPITIDFATPVFSVGAYFTYTEPLTLTAFDSENDVLGTATSLYASNDALYGNPGSSPNEFIQVSSAAGIAMITAEADPNGSSLVMDDLTYQTSSSSTPEPTSLALCAVFGFALIHRAIRRV